QAQAWHKKNWYLEHSAELEALQKQGLGVATVTAQRRTRGARYLHVQDWHELDAIPFKCATSRPLASVLLSLAFQKKAQCLQGSHEGLAEMMGVFGKLCSERTIRNAVDELGAQGLEALPYFEHYPDGFRCRKDRKDASEQERRLREWREASPLY